MARAAQAHDDPQNERGFTQREWTAAGYDPAQWITAVSVLQGAPASPAIADLITRLFGPDGDDLLARIKAHALAPPITGSQGGPTRHQLAHQLTYAKESKWFAAAAAIAANRDTPATPGGEEEESMAKRTKKAKPKPTAPAPTRRGRPPRQADLPGTEDRKIRALEDAAEAYAEIRDERMQLNLREAELKTALLSQMKKLGRTVYHRDGITITVVAEEETVKVRVKKPGDDDEDQDEAPPEHGEEFAEEREAAVNAED